MPVDVLTEILTTAPLAPGPRLTWYSTSERIELTGHVLGMWLAKTAGFVAAETGGAGVRAHLGLPVHWRMVTWAAGCWLAGGTVDLRSPGSGPTPPGLSVAHREELLDDDAEVRALVPLPSLALRWPGDLPPLVLDGAADLLTYPDAFTAVPVGGAAAALVTSRRRDVTGTPGTGTARTGAGGGAPEAGEVLSRDALVDRLPDLGGQEAPVLVRPADADRLLVTVLAAWRAGRGAVLVDPEADDVLAATAARQEGAVEAG